MSLTVWKHGRPHLNGRRYTHKTSRNVRGGQTGRLVVLSEPALFFCYTKQKPPLFSKYDTSHNRGHFLKRGHSNFGGGIFEIVQILTPIHIAGHKMALFYNIFYFFTKIFIFFRPTLPFEPIPTPPADCRWGNRKGDPVRPFEPWTAACPVPRSDPRVR